MARSWRRSITSSPFLRPCLRSGMSPPPRNRTRQKPNQEKPRERRVARIPLIDPEQTTGDLRSSFDRMPIKLNIFRMMAHAEANIIPAMRLGSSILHRQKLSAVNRELLILQA